MFSLLGARLGSQLDDFYPGSGSDGNEERGCCRSIAGGLKRGIVPPADAADPGATEIMPRKLSLTDVMDPSDGSLSP